MYKRHSINRHVFCGETKIKRGRPTKRSRGPNVAGDRVWTQVVSETWGLDGNDQDQRPI